MAQSRIRKDLSASILAGSDEIFDYFCQPCSPDKHLEAVGYCQDCSEYLCRGCVEYHRKLSVSKHHKLLGKSAMPKTKRPPSVRNTDVLTTKCRKHPDKVLEYFCKTHGEICCSVCVTIDHTSCSDKSYIPDVSVGIESSTDYKELKEDLDRLVREITNRQEQHNDDNKNNEKYYTKALTNIKEFRKQINELLDTIENDTKRKLDQIRQDNITVIRTVSKRCQSLLSEVNTMATDIDQLAKARKNNQLFVQVKLSCHRVGEVEKQMEESYENKVTRYSFDNDDKIQHMMSTLSAIWSLSLRQGNTPTKARYVREVNMKTVEDTMCVISGIALLVNDRIAVADIQNKAVKLIDMKVNKVVSRIPLTSEPFDITVVKPNEVALALGNEQKIEIISVSAALSKSHTIKTPNAIIAGLCYNGSNFITACQNPGSVKVIDMSGKTLTTFSTDSNGEQLFTGPRYIALSRDKDVVYITNWGADTVTSMTLSGRVLFVYRHEELKNPRGVAVGKDGAVYVCSSDTHTIHQLTSTGDLTRIILDLDRGIAQYPVAIGYSEENDRLCISSDSPAPENRNYSRLYHLQ